MERYQEMKSVEFDVETAKSLSSISDKINIEYAESDTTGLLGVPNLYDKDIKPKGNSLPFRIIFKHITENEYKKGYISNKTKGRIINDLNLKRSDLKAKVKKNPKNKRAKNEIEKTKFPIYNDIKLTLKTIVKNISTRSKAAARKVLKQFITRPHIVKISFTNFSGERAYSDYINGNDYYEDTDYGIKKSRNVIFPLKNPHEYILYTGDDIRNKSARMLIGKFREFKRNGPNIKNKYDIVGIIDSIGSIRQQKRLLKYLYEKIGPNKIYMPKEIAHRFRCDYEFSSETKKIIDRFQNIHNNANDEDDFIKPKYPYVKSYKTHLPANMGRRNYIIKNAVCITDYLKPAQSEPEAGEDSEGDRQ
jgi:hypothetical protein